MHWWSTLVATGLHFALQLLSIFYKDSIDLQIYLGFDLMNIYFTYMNYLIKHKYTVCMHTLIYNTYDI